MDLFLQYLVNGAVTGSTYVLVAVGLTLIFGILGVVNFAHGEFYMIGGYAGIFAVTAMNLPLLPAIVFVLAVAACVGLAAEAILHRPMKDRDATSSIVSSFGLAVALQNAALIVMGPQPQRLNLDASKMPLLSELPTEFGPVFLPHQRMLIPLTMVALIGALYAVLRYTWTGRSLRAMAQHSTVARLCGVRVDRVAMVTFATGAALAGIAGMLMSSVFLVYPIVGNMIALKAFTVVILGGMGNVIGAAVAGLLLGVIESLTSAYVSNSTRDIVGFVIVIGVLLFLPNGLFGKSVGRS
ncbi:branched-chain amino acid ABC transporter permease [Bradyrhizobium nitroreducens]|uniref:Branched-chain amino acid ABC transporter permease n=1 Tax=Bradyrhizobium nitroreducens TaxID=709803 RepID=A0A2M6UBM1_9BRAD|nr:branched-chain amino acid ABC transporter permease [Bradyrhizobium nitroreducens]PIT01928.1 branched-chain amino acid ABC transporter permease [Bradyrhizobium nitroreducens]